MDVQSLLKPRVFRGVAKLSGGGLPGILYWFRYIIELKRTAPCKASTSINNERLPSMIVDVSYY